MEIVGELESDKGCSPVQRLVGDVLGGKPGIAFNNFQCNVVEVLELKTQKTVSLPGVRHRLRDAPGNGQMVRACV